MEDSGGDGNRRKAVTFVGQANPPIRRLAPSTITTTTTASPASEGSPKPNGLGLVHDTANGGCPGFTGGDAKMAVRPRTLRQLMLDDAKQIVIPLFQRKYCWTRAQGEKWFADLRCGVKKNGWNGCHNTGKAIFKPQWGVDGGNAGTNADRTLICVDGQQRITTTSILLMVLRDHILKAGADGCMPDDEGDATAGAGTAPHRWAQDLKAHLDRFLWIVSVEDSAVVSLSRDGLTDNRALAREVDSWRLVPSYADRRTYQALLLGHESADVLPSAAATHQASMPLNDCILDMYTLMDACVRTDVALHGSGVLETILTQAVDQMYVVSIEIESDPDLAAVFLWLQEKTLLGMGSLLENLAPGVPFHAGDLIRNLLLAPAMRKHGLHSRTLEDLHRTLWLEPIELPAGALMQLDEAIDNAMCQWYQAQWIRPCGSTISPSHAVSMGDETNAQPPCHANSGTQWFAKRSKVSLFELRITQTVEFFRSHGVLKYDTEGIELYGRFITFVDDFCASAEQLGEDLSPEDVAMRILSLLGQGSR